MIARRIYFSETTLSPGRELDFESFFTFDLSPVAAAHFKCVELTCTVFFSPLKRVGCEVLFRFRFPLLLMAGVVGAAVAGGAGASNVAIYRGLMLDA